MAGPLAKVDTKIAALNMDINRKLRWGKGITLEFLVPDISVPVTGLRSIQIIKKGFDRVSGDERILDEGQTVVFQVAAITPNLAIIETLKLKDLVMKADGETFTIGTVDRPAPNESQVYTLNSKVRLLRKKNFENT